MDKKTKIFTSPAKLPLVLMLIFAAVTAYYGMYELAMAEAAVCVLAIFLAWLIKRRKERLFNDYIESITYEADNAKNSTIMCFPLPIAVFRLDDSRIVWGNEMFFQMCGEPGQRLDASLSELVPHFNGGWLLEGKQRYPTLLEMAGRKYQLHGNVIPSESGVGNVQMGITYWVDVTEYDDMRIEYEKSRPVAGIVIIDNLDELTKNQPERIKNDLRDEIEDKLSLWCAGFGGIIRRYDRDRYILLMEKQHSEKEKLGKFSVTNDMHSVVSPAGIHASISIGLGVDADNFAEALSFADAAIELALSRGGDQTVIKNRMGYEFYGGRAHEVEKRTKVRSRVIANAFAEILRTSQKLLIVGHRYADLDSVGACVGVCSIARQLGLKAHIVVDPLNSAARQLVEQMRREPEYKDVFVSPQEALKHADPNTLLCVVDTSRPEQIEEPELLKACGRVTVIDHHRVGATFISEPALDFIEPYASSACELVTEILQELMDTQPLRCEAEALLSGIVLDTKNFTLRTGERTFDAAAYLRRCGADTSSVKKLLQSDMEHTVARYKIMQSAELYKGIAIAAPEEATDRVVAAQAADELLNISGVTASVVVAPGRNGECFASARSIGDVNVQLIMEKVGGGGNAGAAAVQFVGLSLPEAVQKLYAAIDDYVS